MTTDSHENNKDPLIERVLGRITKEHLSPRPRWEFVLENGLFWFMGALAIAFGAAASAAALFEIENTGWRYYIATHPNWLTFFLQFAPFLWMAVLIAFILIGYFNIRRTKRGYRYPFSIIVLGAVLTSIMLGTALYATGIGEEIEEALGDHPPFYRPVLIEEHAMWVEPSEGLLGGQVTAVAPDLSSFTLTDFSGTTWTISTSDLSPDDLAAVARGGDVRVVGVPFTASSTSFHACFVFPFEVHGADFSPPLPPPLAGLASSSERNAPPTRSEQCRGIRPYISLHAMSGE